MAGVFCGHDMFDCTLNARLLASWQPEHTSEVKKVVAPSGPTINLLLACEGMLFGIGGAGGAAAAPLALFGTFSDSRATFECNEPPLRPREATASGMAVPPKVVARFTSEAKVNSGVLAEP